MKPTLIIVESPAKCKKIEEYLGPGYKCIASYGHLRTLPNINAIDLENNFAPTYSLIDEPIKLKQIENIRKEIEKSDGVILATDDDREGEGIAWHICMLFNLPIDKTPRIKFHEITQNAIQKAILLPEFIDMNKVYAQQSRQILDILVGFMVSPLLWKYITNTKNLSAGRCQTPALRIIYDNYLENKLSPGVITYDIVGYFTNLNLPFELNKSYYKSEDVLLYLNEVQTHALIYDITKPIKVIKKSPEPLTTSSLQQLANNELHLSPKETMKMAQILYENGYITYMRTDSKKYSGSFIEEAKQYIIKHYNNENEMTYINQNIDQLQVGENIATAKNAKKTSIIVQEAHEAIRPVNVNLLVDNLKEIDIEQRAKRLYEIIWIRTMESCMASSQYNSITASIYNNESDKINEKIVKFVYKSEQLVFAGWKRVENKFEKDNSIYNYLSNMKKNIPANYKIIETKMSLKDLKSHYSEALLVKALEDRGIGRPSTYASLVDKIIERDYVKKENIKGKQIECTNYTLVGNNITHKTSICEFGNEHNKLVIQPVGILVIEYLINNCGNIFDYDYTKHMEDTLDNISTGKIIWNTLCDTIYKKLLDTTSELKNNSKFGIKIDDTNTLIIGKYGPVIKHVENNQISFINVKKNINMDLLKTQSTIKLEEIVDTSINTNKRLLGKYRTDDLFVKKGKYGLYVEWGTNKQNLKELENTPIESVTYIDVLKILDKDILDPKKDVMLVRKLSSTLSIRKGKFGDYIMYKKPRVTKPEFLSIKEFKSDYKTCDELLIVNWINQTYTLA